MQTQECVGHSSRTIEKPSDWAFHEPGIGFLPLTGREVAYDGAYFDNYKKLAATPAGLIITGLRAELVERWSRNSAILDVGIGCGAFLDEMHNRNYEVSGEDINPVARKWLKERNYLPKVLFKYNVLTFWDVLEHIPEPEKIFRLYDPKWIFISMPIYRNEQHVFRSKHYKPGEHCWYFTELGLRCFMGARNYSLVEMNASESVLAGREDVWSFAFKRIINI